MPVIEADQGPRKNEDAQGNLCVRAGGGHLLHVIAKKDMNGNDSVALCGHQPRHGGSYHMKRRAKWYHTHTAPKDATCEKCRTKYQEMQHAHAG